MSLSLFVAALLMQAASPPPNAAPATEQAEPLSMDWMVGDWTGTGTSFGRATLVALAVAPTMDGRVITLDYSVSAPGAADPASGPSASTPLFAGHGFYRVDRDDRWDGRWVDSTGVLRELSARLSAMGVTTTWGSPSTEIGRTTYAMDGDAMLVTDQVMRANGEWHVFASSRLERVRR